MTRATASKIVATVSCTSFVGGLALTWRSCAFWHSGGALWAALATGIVAAAATYLRRGSIGGAVGIGFAAGLVAFVGSTIIVVSRCAA